MLQPPRKLLPKLLAMSEIRHCDLADLLRTDLGAEEGQKRLDEGIPMARRAAPSALARSKDETPRLPLDSRPGGKMAAGSRPGAGAQCACSS